MLAFSTRVLGICPELPLYINWLFHKKIANCFNNTNINLSFLKLVFISFTSSLNDSIVAVVSFFWLKTIAINCDLFLWTFFRIFISQHFMRFKIRWTEIKKLPWITLTFLLPKTRPFSSTANTQLNVHERPSEQKCIYLFYWILLQVFLKKAIKDITSM